MSYKPVNVNGQATMANSEPVVIASNQTAIPASQSGTWTVQPGNTANTTAWKVDGSAVTQPVSGTVTVNAGTDLNTSALATSAKQDLLLTELQLKADLTETQPVSLATVPSHAVTNAGTFAVQVTSAPTTTVTGPLTDTQLRATAVPVSGTFWQATQPISGTVTVAASTNQVGDVDVAPRTTGGWSVGNFTTGDTFTALTNSAQVVKGSAGKFGGYYVYNPNSSATYVLVYNVAAASVTVGTTTPKLVFCIPATAGANLEILAGIPFDTAMSIAATTTGGGNTAPTTALEAMIWYK
jgi:hypothetical protein